MKTLLIHITLLWLAIVAEQARSDLFPSYTLLLPICAVLLIANRSTGGIVVIGIALLLQDLLRMQTLPFVTIGVIIIGTIVVTSPKTDPLSQRSKSRRRQILPRWFGQSAVIVCSGILLYFGQQISEKTFETQQLQTHLAVSIPIFLMSAAALRISHEFGFRFTMD